MGYAGARRPQLQSRKTVEGGLHPFLAEGHEVAETEAFLTGPALSPASERIQRDPAVREAGEGQCGPALLALLAFMNE